MKFRYEVGEGQSPPRGYGLAYVSYQKMTVIFYPYPLNWIVGLWRKLVTSLNHKMVKNAETDGYNRGYDHGLKSGYGHGRKDGSKKYLEEVTTLQKSLDEVRYIQGKLIKEDK